MRGPIKAAAEEMLGLISVRECSLPLALSAPLVGIPGHVVVLAQLHTNRPLGRPDKILLGHPPTLVFLILSSRYLDWQE